MQHVETLALEFSWRKELDLAHLMKACFRFCEELWILCLGLQQGRGPTVG